MSNKAVFIFTLLGSGIAFFLIFYFYPTQIFDVKLISPVAENTEMVSMKMFLGLDESFNTDLNNRGIVMEKMLAGWMLFLILVAGIPAMLAYRVAFVDKNKVDHSNHSNEEE